MKACCIVAMEMSKSPKPRHFSDSSRERWDKNRHEHRTKSYLKKKKTKRSEEKNRDVCVMSVKWCEAKRKHASLWNGGAGWVMGMQPVCPRKEIPSLAFVCTATRARGAADTMTTSVLQEHSSNPHHLLSPVSVLMAVTAICMLHLNY